MPTPTKRYRGTALSATWTKSFPSTATALAFTGIKKVHFDPQISVKKDAADGDQMPTCVFFDYQDPMVAFETIDPYMTSTITSDMRGTLAWSIADSANGTTTSGGGKSYAVTNAYLMSAPIDHSFREFGTGSPVFGTISSDGTTSPVTLTSL